MRPLHAHFLYYFQKRTGFDIQAVGFIFLFFVLEGKKTFLFSDRGMYVCGLGLPVKVGVEHFTDFDIFI